MSSLLRSLTVGMVLAFTVVMVLIVGSIVFAVSTTQDIRIPLLLTARSGEGADLLGLQVQAPGIFVWFLVLALLVTAPLALLRRPGLEQP